MRRSLILVVRQQMSQSNNSMKALLQLVKDGEVTFTPANDTLEALEDFQFVVRRFKKADSERLIESITIQPHNVARGYDGMIKAVVISGGLTTKGEEYLSTEQPGLFRSWLTNQIVIAILSTLLGIILIGLSGLL